MKLQLVVNVVTDGPGPRAPIQNVTLAHFDETGIGLVTTHSIKQEAGVGEGIRLTSVLTLLHKEVQSVDRVWVLGNYPALLYAAYERELAPRWMTGWLDFNTVYTVFGKALGLVVGAKDAAAYLRSVKVAA